MVDDYTRFTWFFSLRHKHETVETLKQFITQIKNHHELKVNIIRSDNGIEFGYEIVDSYFAKKRIGRQSSATKIPRQNGVDESRKKTLIEAARTLLANSKLPITFWPYAVNTT